MESVEDLLIQSFSSDAVLAAESSKLETYWGVVSKQQNTIQGKIDRIDNCQCVGTFLGRLNSKKQVEGDIENCNAIINPTSKAAFNFFPSRDSIARLNP